MDRIASRPGVAAAGVIGRTIKDAFADVAALLFGSATFEPRSSLEHEVRELVEPHLAILMHRRSRFLAPDANGVVNEERWSAEIDAFVDRCFFAPAPASSDAHGRLNRRQLVRLVDQIVVEGQHRLAAEKAPLPATSRFGSCWAD